MMNSGIYCIRNIVNDKRYVGKAKNFTQRKGKHFKYLFEQCHKNKIAKFI